MNENIPENNEEQPKCSRLSFPLNSSAKKGNVKSVSRRHTLVPNRSILKPNVDGNNTISLISDAILKECRRVSFAPEVTLHKIDYSRSNEERKQKKRSSLSGQVKSPSKLNTSQYLWKSYQAIDESPQSQDKTPAVDDIQSYTAKPSNQFVIDEDSTTQTMEMSIELTQEILKQQKQIREQSQLAKESIDLEPKNSLKDVFEDAEEEINSDSVSQNDDEEIDMELTETFKKIAHTDFSNSNANDVSNNLNDVSMELTQPQSAISEVTIKETLKSVDDLIVADDDEDMEFTQPIEKITVINPVYEDAVEQLESSQMEFTEQSVSHTSKVDQLESLKDDEKTMELTQPISNVFQAEEKDDRETPTEKDLRVVMDISEPPTSDLIESRNEPTETQIESLSTTPPQETIPDKFVEPSSIITRERIIETTEKDEKDQSMDISMNLTSDMETSLIGTEMIPLAEVTGDFTENIDEYDSDNSLVDDNHVNVSLDDFLRDVNVQFYDSIGPSENEINQTLNFNPDLKSSPGSDASPASSSSASSSSTPSNSSNKRANLIEYIDACTDIPYYHYIIHLINQYQSSIHSISTMVNTFSNDVLESNPTAIREYYQQGTDVKADLCTNYQAIATFTRKQAKCQNMRFVSGLLEQLILSYDRANQLLEKELNKALEWRRGVLIERQKMIEKKVELNQYIQKLDTLRDNWNSINVEQIKKVNEDLRDYRDKKEDIKQRMSDASKLVSSRTKSLIDKKAKKTQLVKDLEQMRKQVSQSTVPSEVDLQSLRERLSKLEKSKCVKFIPGSDMTILISDTLRVVFKKAERDTFDVQLDVDNIEKFSPFYELVASFICTHEKVEEKIQPITYVRQLVQSWHEFTNIWKELLILNFLYKGEITSSSFKFQFDFAQQSKHRKKVLIEGTFDNLFETNTDISVHVVNFDTNKQNTDNTNVLEQLKLAFDNNNSIVNRFIIN